MDDGRSVGNGLCARGYRYPKSKPNECTNFSTGCSCCVLPACGRAAIVMPCSPSHGEPHATRDRRRPVADVRQRRQRPDLRKEELQLQQVRHGRLLGSRDRHRAGKDDLPRRHRVGGRRTTARSATRTTSSRNAGSRGRRSASCSRSMARPSPTSSRRRAMSPTSAIATRCARAAPKCSRAGRCHRTRCSMSCSSHGPA